MNSSAISSRIRGSRARWPALLALGLFACASEDAAEERPGPVDDIILTTLREGVPFESSFWYSTASLSLHTVQLGTAHYLALVVDDGEDRPLLIYLPAEVRSSDSFHLVILHGDGGARLTTMLPAAGNGARLEVSRFLSEIECVTDSPDGRREVVHIELDEEPDLITAEVWCKRYGPAGFLGFGRDTIDAQPPVTFSLRRTLSVQNARVWLARNE